MMFLSKYKENNDVAFPPFPVFSQFVRREAKVRNDPSVSLSSSITPSMKRERLGNQTPKKIASIHKTDVFRNSNNQYSKRSCCCASVCHQAKNCSTPIICMECKSEKHVAALHPGPAPKETRWTVTSKDHGGEPSDAPEDPSYSASTSMCTRVCGGIRGKSCAKMCLVYVYPQGHRPDEHSNVSLAKTAFLDVFEIKGATEPYLLKTCARIVTTRERRAHGYVVESLDGNVSIHLPTLIECNHMLDNREEIPTP